MRKCISLDDKLRQMEQEISVNPQFVQKVGEKPPSFSSSSIKYIPPLGRVLLHYEQVQKWRAETQLLNAQKSIEVQMSE